MTIQQALNVQNRSVSSRDAEVLLGAVLEKDRAWLLSHPQELLPTSAEKRYAAFLKRREQNEPVAYILGKKEFYGRLFSVDRRVLIPRPETEALIVPAVNFIEERFKNQLKATNKPDPVRVLELGTGCGSLALTIAADLSSKPVATTIIATDISAPALKVAEENTHLLENEISRNIRLRFLKADLFAHSEIAQQAPYSLIIANLPYVSTTWKMNPTAQPDVVFHEPDLALFGGSDGLDIYRRFFAEVSAYLQPDGKIIIEYGEDQTQALLPLVQKALPTKTAQVFQDYAGLDRVLIIE